MDPRSEAEPLYPVLSFLLAAEHCTMWTLCMLDTAVSFEAFKYYVLFLFFLIADIEA